MNFLQCCTWAALLVLAAPLLAQRTDERKIAELEKRVAALEAQHLAELSALRDVYRKLERGLTEARRTDGGAKLHAELRRVLEPVFREARRLGDPPSTATRQKARAHLQKEIPAALGRLELEPLVTLAGHLEKRILALLDESSNVMDALALTDDELVTRILRPLLDESTPFHLRWNDLLAEHLDGTAAYRAARKALDTARNQLAVARDPLLQYQVGAPEGFAKVPPGAYRMSFSSGFVGTGPRSKDRSFSISQDIFIGLHEVTNEEYAAWLDTLPDEERLARTPRDAAGKPLWPEDPATKRHVMPSELAKHPVVGITLRDALAYAASRDCRLPTEEEWVAAASGPQSLAYPWGPEWAVKRCNDREEGVGTTQPVGSYPEGRGPFGHYDLAGNVAEMTMTYESGKSVKPDAVDDANIVVRGGSFINGKKDVSTGWVWLKRALYDRDIDTGFRLLKERSGN